MASPDPSLAVGGALGKAGVPYIWVWGESTRLADSWCIQGDHGCGSARTVWQRGGRCVAVILRYSVRAERETLNGYVHSTARLSGIDVHQSSEAVATALEHADALTDTVRSDGME